MGILKEQLKRLLQAAGGVTQTNDPMGILKGTVLRNASRKSSGYTDQRSDGDTESRDRGQNQF